MRNLRNGDITIKFELETDLKTEENRSRTPRKTNWDGYENPLRKYLKELPQGIKDVKSPKRRAAEELNPGTKMSTKTTARSATKTMALVGRMKIF